jgi:hypothetical protein
MPQSGSQVQVSSPETGIQKPSPQIVGQSGRQVEGFSVPLQQPSGQAVPQSRAQEQVSSPAVGVQ